MDICIIGLPQSGKTTIFNALTRFTADTKPHALGSLSVNLAVARVPDERLDQLATIFHSKKSIPAEVKYIDIAGLAKGFGKEHGVSGQLLNYLSAADAILLVVRSFEDDNVPHVEGTINPLRDIEILDMELVFSDLIIIEKRLHRLEATAKLPKSTERDLAIKEQEILHRIQQELNKGIPIRLQRLTHDEIHALSNYQFLTAKPMLIVINVGEKQLAESDSLLDQLNKSYSRPQVELITMCGKLEMELAQLSDQEAAEFRQDIGLQEAAFTKVIRHSYALLGLISFFTHNADEVKAWTIREDSTAAKAAGKVHTDMEKGFIRAEVVHFRDFIKQGSMAEARKHGSLRSEGKTYPVQDGDIIHFLFNI
jgi:GTP-binding protein YchF